MNTSNQQQGYKPANIPITRLIAVGLALIGLSVFLYHAYSNVFRHIVGLEEAFASSAMLLAFGVVLSGVAIYVRRRKKDALTKIFVAVTALLVIGALLSFYIFLVSLVGAGSDILDIFFPGSGWSIAPMIISVFLIQLSIFGLSWLISWWLLPVYRHLSQGKVMHSLLAAFLALMIWPILELIVELTF